MGHFKNIIDRVKETYTRIKNYLTQPLHDRTGRVVGNRITIFGRDIQNRIVQTIYQMSVNRISMIVIFHLTAFVRNMYEK